MSEPIFLTVDEVMEIHQEQITQFGGSLGIRDQGLLESAVAMASAAFGGQFTHADLFDMAAAYLFHLVKNHAFVDGNKRVGAAAAVVFLHMNGWDLQAGEPEFGDLVLAAATGTADKGAISEFLRARSTPLD